MSVRRIVAALDTASPATLHAAIDLARALRAELVGLFVEDPDLLRLATLPFAEVSYPTAARRELDVTGMERGLRAKARRLHRELDARLAGESVRWTFEVVRGRIAAAVATVAIEDDIAVVPVPVTIPRARLARAFGTLRAPLLLVREPLRATDRIAVVPAPDAAIADIARAVAALAEVYGRSVLFALPGSGAAGTDDRDTLRPFAEQAVDVRLRTLAEVTAAALDRLLAVEPARIVVIPSSTRAAYEALLDVLPWSMLLLPGPAGDEQAR